MNLPCYKTLRGYGEAEVVIKRSQFIGYAKPAETEEEAQAFIEEIRQRHRQATHNCYAYVVGERDQFQKSSDDGEPSGTAGRPILEVIKNRGLKNTVVVVTRYFGGVLLGAGGLVRAYTDGAAAGIAAAGEVYRVLHAPVRLTFDYSLLGTLEHEMRKRGVMIGGLEYSDKVTMRCLPLLSEREAFLSWVADLTSGRAEAEGEDPVYVEHEQPPGSLADSR